MAQRIAKIEQNPSVFSLIMNLCDVGMKMVWLEDWMSHKPAGEVSFRNIHAGGRYPFAGMGAWLTYHLRHQLANLPHLLKSTDGLVQLLTGFESDVPIKLVKTGHQRDVIQFHLCHQYVGSSQLPGKVWRVLVGTGMGLNFSGDLSDAAFFSMSKDGFINNPRIREQTGILMYARYRDDVFIVLKDGWHRAFCDLMEKWRVRAGGFKLTVEAISKSGLTVLDLDLEITRYTAEDGCCKYKIGYKPHFKPTSLGVPLSTASSHPWHVHASWPFAQIKRLHSLSGSHVSFTYAKHVLVRRLHDNFEPSTLIKALFDII